jgi:hypothetical protein
VDCPNAPLRVAQARNSELFGLRENRHRAGRVNFSPTDLTEWMESCAVRGCIVVLPS